MCQTSFRQSLVNDTTAVVFSEVALNVMLLFARTAFIVWIMAAKKDSTDASQHFWIRNADVSSSTSSLLVCALPDL